VITYLRGSHLVRGSGNHLRDDYPRVSPPPLADRFSNEGLGGNFAPEFALVPIPGRVGVAKGLCTSPSTGKMSFHHKQASPLCPRVFLSGSWSSPLYSLSLLQQVSRPMTISQFSDCSESHCSDQVHGFRALGHTLRIECGRILFSIDFRTPHSTHVVKTAIFFSTALKAGLPGGRHYRFCLG